VTDTIQRSHASLESSQAVRRGFIVTLLFPPFRARFGLAILLTFFPYGILYLLDYPAGELLTLGCWIWVFPSTIGWLSLALIPFIPNLTYGYYAFNLFCLISNLAIAFAAANSNELSLKNLAGLHKFVRICMVITLMIAAVQAITDPYLWMSVFPNMRLEVGRGAGLRLEPSQLSCLLSLYLVLLAGRMESMRSMLAPLRAQRTLLREGVAVILLTVVFTRSFSVLIIVVCFVPMLFIRRKRFFLLVAMSGAGAIVGVVVLGSRISDAIATSGGSMSDLITAGVDSWRNVPDILILSNLRDFLFPGDPAAVRLKIHTFAVMMSPLMAWIQNTFSVFSAGGVTVGVVITGTLMFTGLRQGLKKLKSSVPTRTTWILIFVTAWFFMAKWDPSAWVVLGMLPLFHRLNEQAMERYSQSAAPLPQSGLS
jgi:hypothetical protein